MSDNFEKEIELSVDAGSYITRTTKKYDERKPYTQTDSSVISAVIPGTILKIFVSEKNFVKKGDKIIVLEAMKMENTVIAHKDAVIKEICVTEGDKVAKNAVLIKFEK